MSATNSAAVLRRIWDRYVSDVSEAKGGPLVLSMREVAHRLNLDPSALAKWMSADAPVSRRIPLRHVPSLAEFLMMTKAERDELMEARLSELHETDEVVVACSWLLETLQPFIQAPLDEDETLVLAAFRQARKNYPRGLYPTEHETMSAMFDAHLKASESLYIEEESVEPEVVVLTQSPTPADLAKHQDWARVVRDHKKQTFLDNYTRLRRKYRPKY